MTKSIYKTTSIIALYIATVILLFTIGQIYSVYKTEIGIVDNLPDMLKQVLLISYPFLLLLSFVFFLITKKLKWRTDFSMKILFVFNGVALIILIIKL